MAGAGVLRSQGRAQPHPRLGALRAVQGARLQAWRDAGSDPEERPKPFYKLEAVFSQAQVEPLPPPAQPVPLEDLVVPLAGDELAWTLTPLSALAEELGVTIEDVVLPEGFDGFYNFKRQAIGVSSGLNSDNARAATIVHELAHALVRLDFRPEDPSLGYAEEELVVESVAFTVCGGLGIDMTGASIPYLASWAEQAPLQTIEGTANLIDRLARPPRPPHRGRCRRPASGRGAGGDPGSRREIDRRAARSG